MKRILTFVPLGIGISAAIIYIFNIIQFRIVNNSLAMFDTLYNLRIYLYISIISFILYFMFKIMFILSNKDKIIKFKKSDEEHEKEIIKTEIKEIFITGNKYCDNCGEKIFDTDTYCTTCGTYQKDRKSGLSPVLKNVVYVIKIVILILILYFLLNMLFEYKEKQDPNFKSPFKLEMTK